LQYKAFSLVGLEFISCTNLSLALHKSPLALACPSETPFLAAGKTAPEVLDRSLVGLGSLLVHQPVKDHLPDVKHRGCGAATAFNVVNAVDPAIAQSLEGVWLTAQQLAGFIGGE
jgi:hypothetical protein